MMKPLEDIANQADIVLVLATGNKSKIAEIKRISRTYFTGKTLAMMPLAELAEATGLSADKLESDESELSYQDIARGKVSLVQAVLKDIDLPDTFKQKAWLLGDDYGASISALKFCYQTGEKPLDVVFNEEGYIARVLTNHEHLNGQPAPAYFSKRVIKATAQREGITDVYSQQAFNTMAKQLFYWAQKNQDWQTTATVAVALGRIDNTQVSVFEHTAVYTLIDETDLPVNGVDFDRVQARGKGLPPIALWQSQEKDTYHPRGIALRQAFEKIATHA